MLSSKRQPEAPKYVDAYIERARPLRLGLLALSTLWFAGGCVVVFGSLLDWIPQVRKAKAAKTATEASQKAAADTKSAAEIAMKEAATAKEAAEAAKLAADEALGKVDSAKTKADEAEREAEAAIEAANRWDVAQSAANTAREMREQLTESTSRAVGRATIDDLVKEEGKQRILATKARHDAHQHAKAAEYAARAAVKSANDAETNAGNAENLADDANKHATNAEKHANDANKHATNAENRANEARKLAKAAAERTPATGTTNLSQMAQLADEAGQAAQRAQQEAARAEREAIRARQDVDQMKQRALVIEKKATDAVNAASAREVVQDAEGAVYGAMETETQAETAEGDLRDVGRDITAAEMDADTAKNKAAQVVKQADDQAATP